MMPGEGMLSIGDVDVKLRFLNGYHNKKEVSEFENIFKVKSLAIMKDDKKMNMSHPRRNCHTTTSCLFTYKHISTIP